MNCLVENSCAVPRSIGLLVRRQSFSESLGCFITEALGGEGLQGTSSFNPMVLFRAYLAYFRNSRDRHP